MASSSVFVLCSVLLFSVVLAAPTDDDSVKKHALNIVKDVINGQSLEEAFTKNGKQALGELGDKVQGLQQLIDLIGKERLENAFEGGMKALVKVAENSSPIDEETGRWKTPLENLQFGLFDIISGVVSGFSE